MTETVKTKSFEMEYFKFGAGEKNLVILPGLSVRSVMLSEETIKKAYRGLAEDFTVYVFDRRKDLPPDYSSDDMAKDTAEAIISAGIEKTSVVGFSQGAMMAIKIAARYPDLVEKLVLTAGAMKLGDDGWEVLRSWIDFAEKEDAKNLFLSFGERIYPRFVFAGLKPMLIEEANSATEEELRRFIVLTKSLFSFNAEKDVEKITCPTLVLGDTDDRLLGAKPSCEIAKRLKCRSELYLYSGYGHALCDTAPDYKERILRFLTDKN